MRMRKGDTKQELGAVEAVARVHPRLSGFAWCELLPYCVPRQDLVAGKGVAQVRTPQPAEEATGHATLASSASQEQHG